jgi:wobble nucleotide-excising tRNase
MDLLKAMQEIMEASQAKMLAQIKVEISNQAKVDTNQKEMKEIMKAYRDGMTAKLNVHHEKMACLGKTEASDLETNAIQSRASGGP